MRHFLGAIIILSLTLPTFAQNSPPPPPGPPGPPSPPREERKREERREERHEERREERRDVRHEMRAFDVLSEMQGHDHAWRSSAEDVLRLLHQPGYIDEYMARPDSDGISNSDVAGQPRRGPPR